MTDKHSKARELIGYSFLVLFANDDAVDENELHFIEKLALEDGQIDDAEKQVLRSIFARSNEEHMAQKVIDEIRAFREKYDI